MKRAVSVLLAAMIMVCNIVWVSAEDTAAFDDVSNDHWAYDAVQYFYNANVINGVDENSFAPDEYVTREQFAKLLSIIYNKTDFVATKQTFADVTSDMWSYNYIESVKDYLTGYYPQGGEPFFNPEGKATREDIAYSLVKISGLATEKADNTVLTQFKDSMDISVNMKDYMSIAVSQGLIKGYDGYLRPQDGITRAETATLLFRAIKRPVAEDKPAISTPTQETKPEKEEVTTHPDKPEETTKKSDTYIYSGHITEFKIINTENDNCHIDDPEALKGKIELTFGDDAIEDTKLYAHITVDGKAVYEVKSTSIYRYSYSGKYMVIELNYDVYKNGVRIIKDGGNRTVVEKEDDRFMLLGQARITAEKVIYSLKNMPSVPEKQPYEIWDNAPSVSYSVTKINGDDAIGYLTAIYNTSENVAKVNAEITSNTYYTIELDELKSIDSKHITCSLKIKSNDETVDTVVCKIPLTPKLGEAFVFLSEDGNWEFEVKATEINR